MLKVGGIGQKLAVDSDPYDLGFLGLSMDDPEVSVLKTRVEDQEKKTDRMMEQIVQLEQSVQTMSLGGGQAMTAVPSAMPLPLLSRTSWHASVTCVHSLTSGLLPGYPKPENIYIQLSHYRHRRYLLPSSLSLRLLH